MTQLSAGFRLKAGALLGLSAPMCGSAQGCPSHWPAREVPVTTPPRPRHHTPSPGFVQSLLVEGERR